MVGTAGRHGDLDATDRGGDLSADLEQFQSNGTNSSPGQAGRSQRPSAQGLHQHIGEGSHQEPELIGSEGVGGGAIGEQVELLFLDSVFHLAAGTVDLLIEGLSGVGAADREVTTKRGLGPRDRTSALATTRRLRDQLL